MDSKVKTRRTIAYGTFMLAAAVVTLVVTAAPAAAQSKCTAAKYKAMGKKYASKLKCYSKAVTMNAAIDATCLQKAEAKFASDWAKAEAKGDCLTVAPEVQGELSVDECVADALGILGGCTVTNGGVEICDGLDNDCNATVDDGGAALCDLGLCETIEVCNGAGGCESLPDPNAGSCGT